MKKLKIGAVTLGFNDEAIIGGTIRCLAPFVDKHVVVISENPYFGNDIYTPDRTKEVCEDLGCEVVTGKFELDHMQRNLGNVLCKDCDWIITFDSDEMMTGSEIERMIKQMETTDADAFLCKPQVYWKDTDHVISPKSNYEPVIALRPHVRFWHIRNIDSGWRVTDCEMHHLSWAHPKNIYKKVTTYAHAPEIDGKKWYQEQFIGWKEGTKAILPTLDEYDILYNPLPKELKDCLKEEHYATVIQ